ncbi:hypothetical protein H5V45_09870 [Nocardioides sp. KIGAM211]|uniref:Putative Flp pilus-assembly TadG-like N-terminal domain-containing protein n=1 Tax=Nocardioides luti TaxID=2761101 RepID=A0A7X0VBW9_9ACTN|nr:hypothetical protein [Nocardioides luti]
MRRRDERGSATPVVLVGLAVLLLVGAALGVVAAMVRAHRSAQAAADLSALAVAAAVRSGADPCARGAGIAAANGARLVACRVEGAVVEVRARVEGPHWLGQLADLDAEARAGPA